MTDRNIQTTLVKFEDITNFQVRRTADADQMNFYDFGFDFSELRYSGSQIKSPLFTLNRFSVMFVFFLKKEVTKLAILEAINQYNAETPLTKTELMRFRGKKLEVNFSIDFINNDEDITTNQLEAVVNIMSATPEDFGKHLLERKIAISQA
ncbi:YbjN domain-containing protein [Pseudomonas viridiflava]|uniref:YbjN domain-containing protein n=1 Tax=Pseudomonas viridiflava TaxID=33069 RepID=UPI0013CEC748|nr:YbjN domain-containing protein [Pseudomonas viridiflava]MCJ8176436.1 YbjN domain-containing protein [Pseudomonas viridiflava]